MSTDNRANYVTAVGEDGITVKFCNGETQTLFPEQAHQLADAGQLYGWIDGSFVPCLQVGSYKFYNYYLRGDVLYRADSPLVYNECHNWLQGDFKLYNVKNGYVICYKGKTFVVRSNVLSAGFNLLDVSLYTIEDGRNYVVAQGMALFKFGAVQAIYNEVLYLGEDGVYCLFHSNKKRMEEIVKYYRQVDDTSPKIEDVRQRITNACIEAELGRLEVTCKGNVIWVGNLALNMGTLEGKG